MDPHAEVAQIVAELVDRVARRGALAVLAFDTECSDIRGHVVQLACVGWNADADEVLAESWLLRLPPGVAMSADAQAVHGISLATLRDDGIAPEVVLEQFERRCACARGEGGVVVAHNAAFDCARLATTARACGRPPPLEPSAVFCTMAAGRRKLEFRGSTGRRKAPRNAELHERLTGRAPPAHLHDALVDARLTGESFLAGHARGHW